jgi:hypothetical protein
MIFVLFVAGATAALTWLLGWWGVVLGAAIVGFVFYEVGGGGWRTACAAALAWGLLLLIDTVVGPIGVVSRTLGGVMRMPGFALVLLTLAFPAALAWSVATVVAELRRLAMRYSGRRTRVSATS